MRLVAAFESFARWLSVLSGLFVLGIIAIVVIDILGRSLFNWPLPGGTILSTLLLVCVIFLGLANVQRAKEHYRVDLIANLFPPRGQQAIEVFAHAVGLAVVSLLAKLSSSHAMRSFDQNEMSFDLVPFPLWPARMVLAFGLILLGVQLLIDLVRSVRALFRPLPPPEAAAANEGSR
ncbi:TRAP transporter small permease subunit [Ramlibacter sp.]|uniref:TRAP transporter small permease subunit n=1 Tax=Ramlibacter sp. TaxID=1917967 RepID=UPI003D14292E